MYMDKRYITNITDVVKFDALLDNLHGWDMRVLHPRISHYLDQWTRRKLPEIYMDERSSNGKPSS